MPAQAREGPTLEDAIELAIQTHCGQIYPSPEPEPNILHPLRVMLGVTSIVARVVAVLHDVVEDTNVTLEELEDRGFDRSILEAVDCLSRRPGEAMRTTFGGWRPTRSLERSSSRISATISRTTERYRPQKTMSLESLATNVLSEP